MYTHVYQAKESSKLPGWQRFVAAVKGTMREGKQTTFNGGTWLTEETAAKASDQQVICLRCSLFIIYNKTVQHWHIYMLFSLMAQTSCDCALITHLADIEVHTLCK